MKHQTGMAQTNASFLIGLAFYGNLLLKFSIGKILEQIAFF